MSSYITHFLLFQLFLMLPFLLPFFKQIFKNTNTVSSPPPPNVLLFPLDEKQLELKDPHEAPFPESPCSVWAFPPAQVSEIAHEPRLLSSQWLPNCWCFELTCLSFQSRSEVSGILQSFAFISDSCTQP